MQLPQDTIISNIYEISSDDTELDNLLEQAENARSSWDSKPPVLPAIPVPVPTAPRGRAVYMDPTDPKQIHAIAVRCKYHYALVPALNAYGRLTRKEMIRIIKELHPEITYINAKLVKSNPAITDDSGFDTLVIG